MCGTGVSLLADQSLDPILTQSLVQDIAYHLRERFQALQVCRPRPRHYGTSRADPHRNYTNPAQQRQMYDRLPQAIGTF